jgi:hypothetical protein
MEGHQRQEGSDRVNPCTAKTVCALQANQGCCRQPVQSELGVPRMDDKKKIAFLLLTDTHVILVS